MYSYNPEDGVYSSWHKRATRYNLRKNPTENVRAQAFRLIQYAHDARLSGAKDMARHWLNLHKFWREKGVSDGFI
jgi:hypothetical protein